MRRKPPGAHKEITRYRDYEVHIVGGSRLGFHDLYQILLTVPWWAAFSVIVGGYLGLNALFALAYYFVGGVSNVERGSFIDLFFFSVQTMGTIGYGTMSPITRGANALVVLESVTSLVVTALATGLVFVRFSRVKSKVRFSSRVAVGPNQGTPALTIRVGTERRAKIVDPTFRLTVTRTVTTQEGVTMYRAEQLKLAHAQAPLLIHALTMRHVIDASSPLANDTPETIARDDVELIASMTGTDETTLQTVHARSTWSAQDIIFGARLADVMSEPTSNQVKVDLRRFHDLVPTKPIDTFPYQAELDDLAPLDGD